MCGAASTSWAVVVGEAGNAPQRPEAYCQGPQDYHTRVELGTAQRREHEGMADDPTRPAGQS